ncbi:MAG: hypothetical protein R3264_08395 [Anaerolineae bacterium]|nr:hypothetical protein [Anaerolineae bacterium]
MAFLYSPDAAIAAAPARRQAAPFFLPRPRVRHCQSLTGSPTRDIAGRVNR